MADKPELEIRAAEMIDLPQVQNIFNHYVATSVVTFQIRPLDLDSFLKKFEDAQKADLPYLVATVPQYDDPYNSIGETRARRTEKVVGYASASGFRNFLEGYKHTVEIAIFIHPDFRSQGIGSQLLSALLDALRHVRSRNDSTQPKFKEVIACMAIDTDSKDGKDGEGLREWYEERGFREVGRMLNVGRKFEKWLGVIFLQHNLRSEEEMRGRDIDRGGGKLI